MEQKKFEEAIKILISEFKVIAPEAAKRLQKLPLLRLSNLPSTVRICLKEATDAFSFGKFLSSIAVCRICLEAALVVEHGKREQDLETLINECSGKGILPPQIAEKAHRIRKMGNNYVHMLVEKIADELTRAGKVRRFQRVEEDVILLQVGEENDALEANTLIRDIIEHLYGVRS